MDTSYLYKAYKDWTLAEAKAFCKERGHGRKDDGYNPCEKCPLWEVLCVGEYPENWNLNGFTKAEVEGAKAIKMLRPDAVTIEFNYNYPLLVRDEGGGCIMTINETELFRAVFTHGKVIKLDDIIGDGE